MNNMQFQNDNANKVQIHNENAKSLTDTGPGTKWNIRKIFHKIMIQF